MDLGPAPSALPEPLDPATPRTASLAETVLAQARRTPTAPAVDHDGQVLDYMQLVRASGLVAARLRAAGVRPGHAVAVHLPRSWQLVCVMLGIRRAGATVVPLDRLSPPDRQRHILDDSGAVAVIHGDGPQLPAHLPVLNVDRLLSGDGNGLPAVSAGRSDDTATGFVFYTSGSTGHPKGVEVTDEGVLRLARPGYLDLRPGTRFACLANPAFDALSFEVWVPLLTGGVCVVLDDSQVHSAPGLASALVERRVDTLFITTALFNAVVEQVPDCFTTVGQVLVGGEQLNTRIVRRWYETNPEAGTVLHNVYGPTEATTFALCHPIPRDFAGDTIPIGTPLPGTGVLLRTEDGRTAEPGEVAELLLSGPALALGYRNLPERTAHSFVRPPNEQAGQGRWYRTGDLVRQDTEGRITYVGRADRQVKVRGFRIEPGEVERQILAQPTVRQAYVCTRRDTEDRNELLAFLVLGDELSYDTYDRHLTATLPSYMRPHRTYLVAELPRNANGKVDREALLRDARTPWRGTSEGDTPPVSAGQRRVLEVAEDILAVNGLRPGDRWAASGGDSLKALRFRFEILERYAVDLPHDLVLRADFAALAVAVEAAETTVGEHPPVLGPAGETTAPATSEQERLWLLHQRAPEDRSYDVPLAFRVRGRVDTAALHRALRGLVERHVALRTRLVPTPDGLLQQTGDPYDPWQRLEAHPGEEWQDTADRFFEHRFDLTEGRMLRAAWVPEADGGLLLLHLHHVAVDGWSLNLLFRDLTDVCSADGASHTPLDFAHWQRSWHTSAAYEDRRARLRSHYGRDGEPSPALPVPDAPRARLLRTTLDVVRRSALDRRAAQLGVTRFQLLVSAFAASVYGVTGQRRPLIATPVANRPRPEFADTVGMFANTVLLDLPMDPRRSLDAQLSEHADIVHAVLRDQEVALADVLADRAFGERTPLFDYLFVLENTDFSALRLDGCEVRPLWPEPLGAKCALTLSVVEHESGFDCLWEYRDDLGAERARGAAQLFRQALDHLTGDTDTTVRQLVADYRRSLPDHGQGATRTADFATVAEGFARQVARTPHEPAVATGELSLTYAELDAQAAKLAIVLAARLPDDPAAPAAVALHLRPSVEHIVALLAAARLNLTVVPLDPAYPPPLLRHVLDRADPLCVLVAPVDEDALAAIAPASLPRHVLTLADAPTPVPDTPVHQGARPLYTLFTSGSTGVPKGVQVFDRTLCNLLTWQRTDGGLHGPAVTQQFSMLSFDVSFQEIFTTLCSGGLLRLVEPAWRHDVPSLLRELETGRAERIFLPYVALQLLAEHGVRTGQFPSRLREVVTAGEQLVCTDAIRRWFAGLPGARLFNHYGPTETHVVSGLCLDGDPAGWPLRPAIGRPVANAVLRVVDEGGHPVLPGVTGELLIGGLMAHRCYLGDDTPHHDRFTDDPDLGTFYRTGDLARFDADGLLHYAGRDDSQVKLGGHRLELGQVEAALLQYPGITNAVAAVTDGLLVACVQCRGGDPDPRDLADHLSGLLPAYVRVSRFRRLTELPRTPSGKLDRRAALTAQGRELRPAGAMAQAALSPLEARLAALFETVTGRAIGVEQRFFDAGATSLDLMRFQLRCAGEDQLAFGVPELFEHVSLRALARLIEGRASERTDSMPLDGPRPVGEPIAVIGMAVRLPGAPDLAAFWDLVVSGRRGIEHFPTTDGRVGARSQLAGPLAFDPGRFTISPHEARLMDPQQRQLLMNCVEALAHAGIANPAAQRVGLLAACGENTYFQRMLREAEPAQLPDTFRLALHHEKDFLATKAAYHLGLTGPAFTVQSACSSSLVGVHVAAGMLRQADADVMLVGGVLVDPDLTDGYTYRPQHIFSPDGHCRPFSADAAGTVGGSGTAVVVLKPLAAARRDGDTVYAVVTGSGINNDGSDKLSYSAPALAGQRAAIRTALHRSGRSGTDLGYVEAHGTGTRLGDPVETAALRQAYGLADDARVALSSVKSQIGHLGAAAGVVGLVRAVLAVHHGVIPPTVDFERLNPEIEDGPFRIPVTAEPWPSDTPRVAAVSSFGIGGTNAHLLLEQGELSDPGPVPAESVPCLVLSGGSASAVRADGRHIADYLRANPDTYPQVLRHLQAGRPALGHRAAAVCPDVDSAVVWLDALGEVGEPLAQTELEASDRDPHALTEAWTAGHTLVWPEGPAPAPWNFPPPAFDTAEYDFQRAPGTDEPEAGRPPQRLPAGQWLHQPLWTRLRRARTGAHQPRRTAVVVTAPDADGTAWRFLERHYARVVTVRAGQACARLDEDRYEADPADTDQLALVLAEITRRTGSAVDWLHTLPLTLDGGLDDRALEAAQWACLDTVAALARALAQLPDAQRPRAWLLSHGAQPVTGPVRTPEAGLLAAALEVPRQELGVTLRWADLPGPRPAEWAAQLPDLLLDDTITEPSTALRDGFWWQRTLQPVHAPESPTASVRTAVPGAHLVLGGTGGIGTTLAARLLEHPGNRVVLVARGTETPPALRAHQDRVTLVTADLATDDLDTVVDLLAPHLDGLAGIVHAAGTAAGGLLVRRDPDTARRATAAKLRGALLVERIIAEYDPDYAAYCSSMAVGFGGVGQFDYAAANACLDAYAHHAPPGADDATVRMSIGWDAWREVGMAQHALTAGARHQEHLKAALTPEDGAAVFERALHLQLPHLLVNTTPLAEAHYFYEHEHQAEPAVDRRTLATHPTPGDFAADLAEILRDLLGVDAVDPEAALYDLGADSLTLLELIDEVKRRHGTDIDLSRLSHRVSLAEILGHLDTGTRRASAAVAVEVWQRGPGQDVLCLVHPVGGDIQAYRPLVAALPAESTVCLIADPKLRDPGLPARSIADRAAHYLEAVRAAFPEPNYRLSLVGWSFGAWTALSMAALAEAEGRPVSAVHLLDPPPPGAGQRLAAYDERQVDAVFARELSGNGGGPLSESGRAYAERLAQCCRTNLAAMAEHRLPRLHMTPAEVWLAQRPVEEGLLTPEPTAPGAWDAHLPGTYRLHHLDATHYELVAEPHVQTIAAALATAPALPHPVGRS
ncbi:amino acid adenylation domain-containing protein [Streptomyces sp. 3213]|uniref:non-ribosomal peptide synthetase n=1 Tax=Streptomyces sp. 3213.3 TaxID=1855348 RepID=UPI00089BFE28|nr:non-ribosomal peptide synthetase [Streptomyces sp. 3213.3]SEC45732.1 amino acid adenylation domain-containing protein [Streptomyces sp. 3213] [Streptomyces sp. 3213.3]